MQRRKIYILDTNILIQTYGKAITGFDDNYVIITHTTIEELDDLKTRTGETGYAARECNRIIKELCNKGDISKGVKINEKGSFRIELNGIDIENLPEGWTLDKPDNRIISTAISIKNSHSKTKTILVTNDGNMYIKAKLAGIEVQDYKNDRVSSEKLYTGRQIVLTSSEAINELYFNGLLNLSDNKYEFKFEEDPVENQYIRLEDMESLTNQTKKSALAVYKEGSIILLDQKRKVGVKTKNEGQVFALDALLDPDVPLVILKGPAGCGKTFLSMAIGYHHINNTGDYSKMIISRSNSIPEGEDLGFLPGDLEEKMGPLLSPFFDNLSIITGNQDAVSSLMDSGQLEICSMAYIRGRSIPNCYIVVDEAQNMSPIQVKTLVTRCGIDTKLILLGDPDQIDSQKMDSRSNGLVYCAEKLKGSKLCAQITFKNSESVRSPLSKIAADLL